MSQAVWIITFKLKEHVTQEAFIEATQALHDAVLSKQKGFVSWEQYLEKDVWTDFVVWETLEDANKAKTAGQKEPTAKDFYAMLQLKTCKMQVSELVKHYE